MGKFAIKPCVSYRKLHAKEVFHKIEDEIQMEKCAKDNKKDGL